MEDVFGIPPIGAVTLGTGPGVISSQPDKFSYETNGYSSSTNNRDAGFRQRQQPAGVGFPFNPFFFLFIVNFLVLFYFYILYYVCFVFICF